MAFVWQYQEKPSRHLKVLLAQEITGHVKESARGEGDLTVFRVFLRALRSFLHPVYSPAPATLRYIGACLRKQSTCCDCHHWSPPPPPPPRNDVWATSSEYSYWWLLLIGQSKVSTNQKQYQILEDARHQYLNRHFTIPRLDDGNDSNSFRRQNNNTFL